MRLVGDTIVYCAENIPRYSPVSVCGYHIRESGANPAQEMAYGFCIAKAYIDLVLERGLDIDEFASRLSFNFDIHGNFFEQICKFCFSIFIYIDTDLRPQINRDLIKRFICYCCAL